MKIGLMGGTFNPIHKGHLALAQAALSQYALDEVWFMPSGLPAHKSNAELLDARERLQMVALAIENHPGFVASSFEIDREGFTYTSDTMTALSKEYPEHEFYFIIGGDSLMKFHRWVKPEVISAHAVLLAAGRNGYTKEELLQQADYLKQEFKTNVLFLDMLELNISSNEIRSKIKNGRYETLSEDLPESVLSYIMTKKLYQPEFTVSGELVLTLEQKLQQALKPKRYLHTIGVAYLAASLAMCHGVSHRDALVAGLLHDCAKNYSNEELLEQCLALHLPMSEHEQRIPDLLHAVYGAYLAREEYKITQLDILLAVRNHTLGRPNMTPLEQIVYLADYFEPERTHPTTPSLDEIRKIAFQNLDEATYLVSKNSLQYFEASGKEADPMTYQVFEYYSNCSAQDKTLV